MQFNIGALSYLTAAFAISIPFLPGGMSIGFRARIVAMYAVCAYALVSLSDPFLILFVSGALIACIAPADRVARTAFFIAAVPALPVYLQYDVPFPGLQYFITLTPMVVAVLVVLVPASFARAERDAATQSDGSKARIALVIYCIFWGVLVGEATSATTGARHTVSLLLATALPYILIERHIRSMAAFDTAVRAFVAAAAILAVYAMIATFLQWDIYRYREVFMIANFPDFRSGFLRIQATANSHSLAYFAVCAIFFVSWLRRKADYSWTAALILQALLLATVISTDSRGGLLALLFAIVIYSGLTTQRKWLRVAVVVAAAIGIIQIASQLLFGSNDDLDAHGTFSYRQELLLTSLDYIPKNPIFGDINFRDSGRFDHLRIGAAPGHIDITNLYLLRALELGLVGFALYFYVFSRPLLFPTRGADGSISIEQAMLKSLIAGWLVLVATTSDVGITQYIAIVLVALSVAIKNLLQASSAAHKS